MKELKIGEMTYTEIAEWFGIKKESFLSNKKKKLEELQYFADFRGGYGKVNIIKIYYPAYSKKLYKELLKEGKPASTSPAIIWQKRYFVGGEEIFEPLTKEEYKIFKELQDEYLNHSVETQMHIRDMVAAGVISKEEAWKVFDNAINFTENYDNIKKDFKEKVGADLAVIIERTEKVVL